MNTRRFGFTLLEVMVAIAILAVALAAILSSESGVIKTAMRTRNTNAATLLARCKLAEIEEKIMREGFPAVDAHDEDECCEDAELEGYECRWKVDRVVMPDVSGDQGGDSLLGGAAGANSVSGDNGSNSGGVDSFLANGGSSGAMGDGLADFAISLVYPVLKPTIEEQVRRATVEVFWKEGEREHSFKVVQYLVSDAPAVPPI